FEPRDMEALSAEEKTTLDRDSLAYDEELRRKGHFIAANALQPVSAARTVRVRSRKKFIKDGPFAETKEQLGGFILLDAANMDEALAIAENIPMACVGCIEVRPTMEINPD